MFSIATARTQQDALPEAQRATRFHEMRDVTRTECCLGLGSGGGQKAAGNGAGAKKLTLRRWTKNSLFLRESVKLIAWRGHRSNRQATTPAQSQQREQMAAATCTGRRQSGRGAANISGMVYQQVAVNQGLVTPSRASTASLRWPRGCLLGCRLLLCCSSVEGKGVEG